MLPPSLGSKNKPIKKLAWKQMPGRALNWLHGVISQKTELFVTAGVRTSIATWYHFGFAAHLTFL
jgi:hypothetical protein